VSEYEIMQRVVALLTALHGDDGEGDDPYPGMLSEMLADAVRGDSHVTIPRNATPQETTTLLLSALAPRVTDLAACFTAAWLRLAEHHDAGHTHLSSTDILRELALEAAAGP
jgi:hypothetical protein